MRANTWVVASMTAISQLILCSSLSTSRHLDMVYDFSELTASPSLAWSPCYDNFTCALLEVPRDYANESAGTLNIAIIKKPGSTPDAQEVLVNPGGPGGSAVAMILSEHTLIQTKIGTEYSLVGIDPRGVNNSEPSSDCFQGYPYQTRNAFLADVFSLPDITSETVLKKQHQSMLAYGMWCSEMYSTNGTAKYASTMATAQDMLHYIKLRAKDLGHSPDDAKLWYYGISYGSILGPTFASLYPERVGRMIIDGVLGLEDYYNGGWETAIDDTDKAAEYFFRYCFEAGPTLCAFHQNATSWRELEQRYRALLVSLEKEPLAIANAILDPANPFVLPVSIPPTPFVLTWTDVVSQFFGTIYLLSPAIVLTMDIVLFALQTRNVELLSVITLKSQISTWRPTYDDRMARTLIACLDSNGRSNYTEFAEYTAFVDSMYNRSNYGGLSVAVISGPICSRLDVQAPVSQRFDGISRVDGTHTPILFISSVADPITPLSSAYTMNGLFPGSGLLVFNNSGHTAHYQTVTCVSRYEMQYMRDGTIPPVNTTCEVDEPNPWIIFAQQSNLTHLIPEPKGQ